MSKQTKHRYINSFFLAFSFYLLASFFLFFLFADTLVISEKKVEEIQTISLQHVDIKPQKKEQIEPEVEQEIIPEPVVQTPQPIIKKVEKPKPPKPKKEFVEHKKIVEKKPIEKVVEHKEISPISQEKIVETIPPKPMMSASEMQNLESEYLSKVRFHIEKNKTYPKTAKRLNQTGKVYVKFMILKDGKIKHCKIHKNSDFESLDSAAIEIFEKISNFEKIPDELNKNDWEIIVPIVYQISRG